MPALVPLLLAATLALAGGGGKAPAKSANAWPTAAKVTTEDGVALAATVALPAGAQRGVVLLHMNGRNKEDWNSMGDKLARTGVAVAAVDLREHGASLPAGATADRTAEDYAAMAKDARAAVKLLLDHGVGAVIVVGAELGANLAINAAVEEPKVAGVVMLSPGMEIKGVIATDAVQRYGKRPLLLVTSQDDTYSARSSANLDRLAQGDHALHILENAGKGTIMFNREPALEGYVVGWINTHWAPVEAPNGTTNAAVKVKSETMQTSGPTELPTEIE
jgi:pimeloyl-ACP methyl ester carboxylesterase